jgi:hypothetical protein
MNTIAFIVLAVVVQVWIICLAYELGFSNGWLDGIGRDSTHREPRPLRHHK